MDKKTALVTGVTGQDGSYLVELLLGKGYEVHGIIRRASTFNTERIDHLFGNKNLILHHGDLTDSLNINKLISDIKPDEIYNLGAQSHVLVSFEIPEYSANTDGLGTLRLLDAMKTYCPNAKFYQASTSEMFGGQKEEMPEKGYNENTTFHPRSPYGVAKLYAHWITRNYREAYNLFACSGILFNHESPRRGKTFVTKKITDWCHKYKENENTEPLELGNINAYRDWGHAKDYVKAMWLMLQQDKPDDYVIATGDIYTVKQFVEKCFEYMGKKIKWEGEGLNEVGICQGKIVIRINSKYFRPSEVDVLLGDSKKAREKLGWKQEYNFESLVKEMMS